jgi:tetratricopeptide (TPR) repeat protein
MNAPRSLAASLVLLFVVAAPARAEDAAVAAKPDLKAVSTAFEAADHRKVISLAESFPADSADAPKALYLAGESHLVLGEAEGAEKSFRLVLEARPKAVPALVGLGRALSLQARHEDAEKTLRSAVALDAKDAAAQRTLGEALIAAGKTEEGTKLLEAAVKAAPNDPFAARALTEARLKAEDLKGAKAVADKFAKAVPKHPMGDFLVALALDRQGEHKDAIEAYERALAKDDKFLDAHKNLAILCHVQSNTYQDQARVKKAFEHYERYFELGGADAKLKQMYDTMKAYFAQQGQGK